MGIEKRRERAERFRLLEYKKSQNGWTLISKIKKLFGCNLQDVTEFENHIKRNADVSKFDGADMASVDIDQFGELHLGQTLFLPVINDVQPELFVELFVFRFHTLTSPYSR